MVDLRTFFTYNLDKSLWKKYPQTKISDVRKSKIKDVLFTFTRFLKFKIKEDVIYLKKSDADFITFLFNVGKKEGSRVAKRWAENIKYFIPHKQEIKEYLNVRKEVIYLTIKIKYNNKKYFFDEEI